jgi:hypothetical protein
MRSPLDTSTLILAPVAVVLAVVAYLKDPGGVVALLLAGLMQALVPEDFVSRHFGQAGGVRALLLATLAGVVTPGGPMVPLPSLAFPLIAGWLVSVSNHE